MKKTLTANISGTVFHIEEDAYDKLQRYLGTIRGQFTGTEGCDEIIADIEARIAELFQERLDGKRNVVSVEDVDHVIGIMGQPEDYMGDDETDASDTKATGTDGPNWTYGGGRKHRRLMRDTEDRWVGGVLSGIAAYFGVDPLILRLVYIVLLFLGVGWLIYVILWIVVPPAETAAEKLEMRGEEVNVENIKRMFNEGTEKVKSGTQRMANEAEELGKRWTGPEARARQQEFRRGASRGMSSFVTVLGKLIGIFLLGLGVVFSMMLIAGLIGGGTLTYDEMVSDGGTGYFELGGLLFASGSQAAWFVVAGFLLLLIPILGLILGGLRLLFELRSPRWFTGALGISWFAALIVVVVLGIRLGNDFRRSDPLRTEVIIQQPAGQVLYLDNLSTNSDEKKWVMAFDNGHVEWDGDGLHTSADSIHGAWADLDVKRSPDGDFHLLVERKAQSRSSKTSMMKAANITFTTSQTDSLLMLSPWLVFPKVDKIRAQRLKFVVQVPLGKAVHFSGTIGFMLDDVKNVTNTYDGDMVGRTWTMTPKGLDGNIRPEDVPDSLITAPPAGSTEIHRTSSTIHTITITPRASTTAGLQAATVWPGPPKKKNTTKEVSEEMAPYVFPNLLGLIFHQI